MPLLTLHIGGRFAASPPVPLEPAPLHDFRARACPYCRTELADIAVQGRAAVRMRCTNRACRRVVTLTCESKVRHTAVARDKKRA